MVSRRNQLMLSHKRKILDTKQFGDIEINYKLQELEKLKLFYIHNFVHHMNEVPPYLFDSEDWKSRFFKTTENILTA